MKGKHIIHGLITLLLAVMLSGCREKIELTLGSTYTRLVVEGSITDEAKAHTVRLTLTTDYLYDQQPPPATGAMMEITDGTQSYQLTETSPGMYQTDATVKGIPGRTYTLIIKGMDINDDNKPETYTATDLMKPGWALDSIVVADQKPGTTPVKYKVSGWGLEPATPDNCYQWVYYLNGKLQTDTLYKTIFTDDTYVNGRYLPGLTMFMDITAAPGDTLSVETRSISRPYYTFLVTLMLETVWNQGGAAGPPANVKGNVNNGAIGYFSAFGVTRNQVVVP